MISFQKRVLKRLLRKLLGKKALRITLMDMSDLSVSMKDKAAKLGYFTVEKDRFGDTSSSC